MNCVNCSSEITGKYCSACGQPTGVQRITFKHVLGDIQSKFLGLDNQFARTVIDATIRPGKMFGAVLAGNRRKYMGAGGYLFLMLSLMILLFDIFEVDTKALFGRAVEMQSDSMTTDKQRVFADSVMNFIAHNFRLISFLMLPIYAGFSRFIFRKVPLNFVEHVTLNAYTQAHPVWITLIGGLLLRYANVNISDMFLIVTIGYSIWFYMDYFKEIKPWRRFLKALLVQIYALISLMIIGIVIAIIYVLNTMPQG